MVNDYRGSSHKRANVSYHKIDDARGFAHRDLSNAPPVRVMHRLFLRTDTQVEEGQELLGCYGREFKKGQNGEYGWHWKDCDDNGLLDTVCVCVCVCVSERERERESVDVYDYY